MNRVSDLCFYFLKSVYEKVRVVIQQIKPNISEFQESKLHWLEVEALAFRRMMILLSEKNQLVRVRVHFHFANIHSDVSTLIILLGSSVYASSRTRKCKDCKILFMIINSLRKKKVNFGIEIPLLMSICL